MTPHFPDKELVCECGCGMLPEQEFMDKVEQLRLSVGFSLPVSSAARCPAHNAEVSGTGATGPHTTGRAIDFSVTHARAYTVMITAMRMGFSGIGVQQKGGGRFIHIDDLPDGPGQPRPTVWSY